MQFCEEDDDERQEVWLVKEPQLATHEDADIDVDDDDEFEISQWEKLCSPQEVSIGPSRNS